MVTDPPPAPGVGKTLLSSPLLVFGGLAVLALSLRLACATGLIGSDDLHYAKYARAIVEGNYQQTLEDSRRFELIHLGLRYGVLIPLAAIYKLFGVKEWTTTVLPLLASTISVLLLVAIGRRIFDMRVAAIAGLLYATFPLQLRYATVLVPEPIAECFALAGILCYLHARERGGPLSLIAGALLGSAYLAKEPALFIGGALVLHALWERRWSSGILLGIGLASAVVIEHAYYLFAHGDILFRPHSTTLFNLNDPENIRNVERNLPRQLFGQYPRLMLVPNLELGIHSLAAVVLAATALALKPRRGYALVLLWVAIPWLYLNFGSWSLDRYVPLPRGERYLEFTYPPLMLLSGVVLSRMLRGSAHVATSAILIIGLVAAVGVSNGVTMRGRGYRAEEMTVLREIVRRVQTAPAQTIYTDDHRWREALDVFDASLVSTSPDRATFVLERDPVGLPALRQRLAKPPHGEQPSR